MLDATRRFNLRTQQFSVRHCINTFILLCYIPRFAEQLTDVCAEQKNGKYLLLGTTTRFLLNSVVYIFLKCGIQPRGLTFGDFLLTQYPRIEPTLKQYFAEKLC